MICGGHMEHEKITINEEGALKDAQHPDIAFLDTWAKGSGRHRVFRWSNSDKEASVNEALKTCFLGALIVTAIRLLFEALTVRSVNSRDGSFLSESYRRSFALLALISPAVAIVLWVAQKEVKEGCLGDGAEALTTTGLEV